MTQPWQFYPDSAKRTFKTPPTVVLDEGRKVLLLKTAREAVGIWREIRVDINATPRLRWEWKPLMLPQGRDLRLSSRNDQVARVMVMFEDLKAILYIWDSTAPVGTEIRPDGLELVQRALVVIRSGPNGIGEWHREARDVYQDYTRIFQERPRQVKSVGLESHSDDVGSESAVLIGSIRFEER